MKKLYLLLLPFLISGSAFSAKEVSQPLARPANENVIDTYYQGIDANAGSYQLLGQLRDLMFTTRTKFLSYQSDLSDPNIYMQTDYDPEHPDTHFIDFYTHTSQEKTWNGTKYNREHVWCTSHSSGVWGRGKSQGVIDGKDYSEKGAGCDIHHVRISTAYANLGRNDKIFTEFPKDKRTDCYYGGKPYGYNISPENNNYFEPYDFAKGDVARILMYVFTFYSAPADMGKNLPVPTDEVIGNPSLELYQKGKLMRTGNLEMTEIINGSPDKPNDVMASWQLLLKWHHDDPVDQLEINRNNGAYAIQGNRNPFIDHPEWAEKVFVVDKANITPPSDGGTSDSAAPLDTKTIIIIAVATTVLAVTLITVIILVYRNKRKRM